MWTFGPQSAKEERIFDIDMCLNLAKQYSQDAKKKKGDEKDLALWKAKLLCELAAKISRRGGER